MTNPTKPEKSSQTIQSLPPGDRTVKRAIQPRQCQLSPKWCDPKEARDTALKNWGAWQRCEAKLATSRSKRHRPHGGSPTPRRLTGRSWVREGSRYRNQSRLRGWHLDLLGMSIPPGSGLTDNATNGGEVSEQGELTPRPRALSPCPVPVRCPVRCPRALESGISGCESFSQI